MTALRATLWAALTSLLLASSAQAGSPWALGLPPAPHARVLTHHDHPRVTYGFPTSTYHWGWFGTHYRGHMSCHYGFYNNYSVSGYRCGY